MTAQDLGTKRNCPECSARFYDFGAASPFTCPKCSHSFDVAAKAVEAAPVTLVKDAPKPKKNLDVEIDNTDSLDEEMGGVEALENFDDEYGDTDVVSLEEVEDHHEDPDNDINGDDADDEMFMGSMGDRDRIIDRREDYDELELEEEEE